VGSGGERRVAHLHDDPDGATLPIGDFFSHSPNEDCDLVAYAVPVLEVLLERGLTAE
jgi:hypothetical protein